MSNIYTYSITRGERRIPESYCSAVIYGEYISGVGMDEILLNEIMKVSKKEFIIMKDDLIKIQNIGSGDFKYQDEVKDKKMIF
ncbi:hypothetical protein [Xenorhabdus bovienii]|uniref:hypothetical protein n=1 Tax=Xenorhabdus bovienii TaxID=40576 RepID=UPI0023B30872|nr:hypothetical protein [Xenorhabdus bovienii]MDE9534482.1 hypothetical protein [Xenorhabdus bovienii]MDE9588893.1 hypothetical protein [Xenorhabdus bovienii]